MAQKVIKIREGFNVIQSSFDNPNTLYINNNENLNNVNGTPIVGNSKRCFNPNSEGFSWENVSIFLSETENENCEYIKMANSTYNNFNMTFFELYNRYFIVDCDNSTFVDSTFSHAIFKNIGMIYGISVCDNAIVYIHKLAGHMTIRDSTALAGENPVILNVDKITNVVFIISDNNQDNITINITTVTQYIEFTTDPEFYVLHNPLRVNITYLTGSIYITNFPNGYAEFHFNIDGSQMSGRDSLRPVGIVFNNIAGGAIRFSGDLSMASYLDGLFKFSDVDVENANQNPILHIFNATCHCGRFLEVSGSRASVQVVNSTISSTQYLYSSHNSTLSIYTRNLLTNYTSSSYVGDPIIINTITQDANLKI
jgi:hypothetical protein